jgi:hypothetical protein
MREDIPPFPQYIFMACCLVKHRDSFTFTFKYFQSYCKQVRSGQFHIYNIEKVVSEGKV